MPLVLNLHSYPELNFLSSKAERRQLLSKARRESGNHPIVVLGALQIAIGIILFARPLARCLSLYLHLPSGQVASIAATAILAFITGMIFHVSSRSVIRRQIREELAARGVAICVRCGYDLRGSGEQRCPECGTQRSA